MEILGFEVNAIAIILIILAAAAGISSRFIFKKTDNVVEEAAERYIKDATGMDFDLSPDTEEKL